MQFRPTSTVSLRSLHTEGGGSKPPRLTHTDAEGRASMVDVSSKPVTTRVARAECRIFLGKEAYELVEANNISKGDVITVAQLAGICASKHTALLIPLCHSIPISYAAVDFAMEVESFSVKMVSTVKTSGTTGVEMEALTVASVAALTIYDMCKAVTHDMTISDLRLLSKTGGARGQFCRDGTV